LTESAFNNLGSYYAEAVNVRSLGCWSAWISP